MKSLKTEAIVLRRVNYGEADRILTLLTKNHGKISAIAKGSRRSISKLAGGIELLSVNEIAFAEGKSELRTIMSTRANEVFNEIVKDIDRTMLVYDLLKLVDKFTEHEVEEIYFQLTKLMLEAFDHPEIPSLVSELWFRSNLLEVHGSSVNLNYDPKGEKLKGENFQFSYDDMCFFEHPNGGFEQQHIKFLRLLSRLTPAKLATVNGSEPMSEDLIPIFKQATEKVVKGINF